MVNKEKEQPKSPRDPFQELDLAVQLADLKLHVYRQSLMLSALIQLLIEKKCFRYEELAQMAIRLDQELGTEEEEPPIL